MRYWIYRYDGKFMGGGTLSWDAASKLRKRGYVLIRVGSEE